MTRRSERRAGIDILYQADVTGSSGAEALAAWVADDREVSAFTRDLVAGVDRHLPEIDLLLETHAQGWSVARMAVVDRTILRLGVEELLYQDDIPTSVAISEAVEAANELSTSDSGRFVNGILGRIAREETGGSPGDASDDGTGA